MRTTVLAAAAGFLLVSCGGSNTDQTPSTVSHSASLTRTSQAASSGTGQLPLLPQSAGAAVGPVVPGGLDPHPLTVLAPIKYPGNASGSFATFLTQADITDKLNLAVNSQLHFNEMTLKQFGSIAEIAAGRFNALAVARDRMVYEVTTTFSLPFSSHGNTWSTGTRKFVADAATGDVIYTLTTGTLVSSTEQRILASKNKQSVGTQATGVIPASGATSKP
ncbi:MAG: hypothetical protein WAJ85_01855 [Candidatus Baltobacteraceae bacterium]